MIYAAFSLMVGLPLCAGWHGSQAVKSFGKKMMTRKDMRLVPNRSRQYQQNRWERVLAKKARAQRLLEQWAVDPVCNPVFEHSTAVDSVRTKPVSTSQRHSIIRARHNPTVFVFSLLLMAQLASGESWCSLCQDMKADISSNHFKRHQMRNIVLKDKTECGKTYISHFPESFDMDCPHADNRYYCNHYRDVGRARAWYDKGKHYVESFEEAWAGYIRCKKDYEREHPRPIYTQDQIDEQNRHRAMQDNYEYLMLINTYMSGGFHHLNPDYKRSFDAFVRDPEKYLSRPDQEFSADPLILMGAVAEEYAAAPCCVVGTKNGFLKLMRSDSRYINIVEDLIMVLLSNFQKFDLNGEKDKLPFETFFDLDDELYPEVGDVKKHITWLIETINEQYLEPEDLASRLEWLLKIAITDKRGFAHLKARLDEQMQGVLYAGSSIAGIYAPISYAGELEQAVIPPFIPGIRIVCSSSGLCGISDAVSAALSGARTDFVAADMRMRSLPDRFSSAQDLLNIIREKGEYAGEPYRGPGVVGSCVRSIQGGYELASKTFELFARGNTVQESYNRSLILDDGTKITYAPATAATDGDTLIIIDQMPRWINPDTITLRFRPMFRPIKAESKEEGFGIRICRKLWNIVNRVQLWKYI